MSELLYSHDSHDETQPLPHVGVDGPADGLPTTELPIMVDGPATIVLPILDDIDAPVNTLHYSPYVRPVPPTRRDPADALSENAPRVGLGDQLADMHLEYSHGLTRQLEALRTVFAGLSENQRVELEPYLERTANTVYSNHGDLRPHKGKLLWSEWLAQEGSPATLQAFADVHAAELEARSQDPAVAEAFADVKNDYIQQLEPWVRQGRLSAHVLTKIPRLQAAAMRFGDPWDTDLQDRLAYKSHAADMVTFGQRVVPVGAFSNEAAVAGIRNDGLHELDHVANGTHMPKIFREVCAEHIALCMEEDRAFEAFDPAEHPNDDGSYVAYRQFAAFLSERGATAVPVALWTQAHSSAGKHSAKYQEFSRVFNEAWGKTPERVNNTLQYYEKLITKDHPDWHAEHVTELAARRTAQSLLSDMGRSR